MSRHSVLCAALVGAPLLAQGPYSLTVLHVNQPGHPTNVVPGLGLPFNPGGTGTSAFERPTFSADGAHFAINVLADTATTADDDVLLLDGAVLLREGSPTPWAGGFNIGTINAEFGLNNAGNILLGHNSSATTNDDYVLLYQAGTWSILAQEAGLVSSFVPGLFGDGGNTATWDDTMDCVQLTNADLPVWRAIGIDALATTPTTANDAVIVIGNTAIQKGVTVPAGQAGGGTLAWELFDPTGVNVSADGSLTLVQGDLTGTTNDDILTLNGAVVVQEGTVLPGFATGVTLVNEAWIDHANNWYARGSNLTTGFDWYMRNGVIFARMDDSETIMPGTTERWDDASFGECFFAVDGNSLGQVVFGGVTNNPSTSNGVILFDDGVGNRYVVVREGDPVDLNGNGIDDDDRYYNTFGDDDLRLFDDGTIVFTATLKNSAGTAVDQGLFKLVPRTASCTFRNGTGINPVACTCLNLPIVGNVWNVDVSFGPQTLVTGLLADFQAIPPFPIFGGELLIAPAPFFIPTALNVPFGWQGLQFSVQGLRIDVVGPDLVIVLTNAQDVFVGH